MPPTHRPSPLKMIATTAAADINDVAVALAERFAAFVPFQRHQPNLPPTQNVHSAVSNQLAAGHFGR